MLNFLQSDLLRERKGLTEERMRKAATKFWPDARAGRCGGEVGWRVPGAKQHEERIKKIIAWARWGLHGKRLNNARYCTYRLMASRPLGGTLFGVTKRHISTTKSHQKSVFRHVNFSFLSNFLSRIRLGCCNILSRFSGWARDFNWRS